MCCIVLHIMIAFALIVSLIIKVTCFTLHIFCLRNYVSSSLYIKHIWLIENIELHMIGKYCWFNSLGSKFHSREHRVKIWVLDKERTRKKFLDSNKRENNSIPNLCINRCELAIHWLNILINYFALLTLVS